MLDSKYINTIYPYLNFSYENCYQNGSCVILFQFFVLYLMSFEASDNYLVTFFGFALYHCCDPTKDV